MKRLFILLVLSSWIAQAMEQDAVFAAAQKVPVAVWERIIGYATTDVPTITGMMQWWQGLRKVIPQTKGSFRNKGGTLDKAKILDMYFKGLVDTTYIEELSKKEKSEKSKSIKYRRIEYPAGSFGGAVINKDLLGVMHHCRAAVSPLERLGGISHIDEAADKFRDIVTIPYEELNKKAICEASVNPKGYQLFRILAAHTTNDEFESVASEILLEGRFTPNVPVILYVMNRLKDRPEKLKEAINKQLYKMISFLKSFCTSDKGREYSVALLVQHGADLSVQWSGEGRKYGTCQSVREIMELDTEFSAIMNNPFDEKWKREYEEQVEEERKNVC